MAKSPIYTLHMMFKILLKKFIIQNGKQQHKIQILHLSAKLRSVTNIYFRKIVRKSILNKNKEIWCSGERGLHCSTERGIHGLTSQRDGLTMLDRATDYKDCFALFGRHANEAARALR